jgi:hypothetical protein
MSIQTQNNSKMKHPYKKINIQKIDFKWMFHLTIKKLNYKQMKYATILYILISAFILNSCELLSPCLEGTGNITTEERSVASFTSIVSSSDFDVAIRYSTTLSVTVEADENLQQYIRVYVENGDLKLETEQGRCLQSQERILVTVNCTYVESVVLSGSGDIDMSDFTVDYFNLDLTGSGDFSGSNIIVTKDVELSLSGSGDVSIDGKATNASYRLSGSGDIRANSMKVTNCDVVLSGSGNIYTYVLEYLKVVLSGSGDVYLYGDPADIDQRITGSGKIVKR